MPKQRVMSLTPDLVRLCYRKEPDLGYNNGWAPLQDEDYRRLAEKLARECAGEPLWIFAYGSLIWKPEFDAVESQRATAYGWHRSFCLELSDWRGTPEQPGLMMALERGGRCDGVIYRLPDGDRVAQIERLLRREVSDHESVASVRWMPVDRTFGKTRALGFWVGMTGRGILLRHPLEAVAKILARACGHIGSCAEYLYNTVSHLEECGIRDRNLWRLQVLVAQEIRTIHNLEAEPHDIAALTAVV